MKRHDSLIPLTHDHHHALAQARALRLAAGRGIEERLRQAKEFLAFFQTETTVHFREEEEVVFPLVVQEHEAEPVLKRVMLDHLRIHSLVRTLGSEADGGTVDGEVLTNVAGALEAHIRFEEKTVFPLIERLLPEETISGINLHHRERSLPSATNRSG